jgi:lysophospholipase L1-like esterase
MEHVLVYGDSLSWGIVPETRRRLPFEGRWPGVMEAALSADGRAVRVIEDCLNGRRTAFEDPYEPGRNGLVGLEQRIEATSPVALVVLFLGTNDFQSMHPHTAWHAGQGITALVRAIRRAPIEPGMPVPRVLVVAPPVAGTAHGTMAEKFRGADVRSAGLADVYARVAVEEGRPFFDAGAVVRTSALDGVHLDADQHVVLGRALAAIVGGLL